MNRSLKLVLKSEGGFTIESEDVGGSSYAGITQDSYQKEYLPVHGHKFPDAPATVRELGGTSVDDPDYKYASPLDIPEEHGVRVDIIQDFYENFYLPKSGADLLPECLQYIHSDFFVNARGKAVKIIQEWAGCREVDGHLGPETRQKVAEWTEIQEDKIENDPYHDNELITAYDEAKRDHYTFLATENPEKYGENLRGWLARCDHVKAELHDYFVDESPTPSAVLAEDDIDLKEVHSEETVLTETRDMNDAISTILSAIDNITTQIGVLASRMDKYEEQGARKKW